MQIQALDVHCNNKSSALMKPGAVGSYANASYITCNNGRNLLFTSFSWCPKSEMADRLLFVPAALLARNWVLFGV